MNEGDYSFDRVQELDKSSLSLWGKSLQHGCHLQIGQNQLKLAE